VLGFVLAQQLGLALLAFWGVVVSRTIIAPLEVTWLNTYAEPQVRATMLSINNQVNAFGQIAGGPVVGWIATLRTVRFAIGLSGLMLLPILVLLRRSQNKVQA
jgi:MFS transporter, DHA3 family, tetracycline resistance protein